MVDIYKECGRVTKGRNEICSTCRRGEAYNEHAQSLQRRETRTVYADAQSERIRSLAERVSADEKSMRDEGLDPNKHSGPTGD